MKTSLARRGFLVALAAPLLGLFRSKPELWQKESISCDAPTLPHGWKYRVLRFGFKQVVNEDLLLREFQ